MFSCEWSQGLEFSPFKNGVASHWCFAMEAMQKWRRFERGLSSQTSANFSIASVGQTPSRSWNTFSISFLTSA